jgi:hypothetical protein
MNLYKIRMWLKHNKIIYGLYELSQKNERKKLYEQKKLALQEEGMSVAKKIEEVLGQTEFTYYIAFGSLLGLIREGKFLGHDIDIDYAVILDEKFSWEKLEEKLTAAGFEKIREYSFQGRTREQSYKINGLPIDFFGSVNEKDYTSSFDFFRKDEYTYQNKYEMHVREGRYSKIEGTKKMTFNNVEVSVPMDPIKYLESVYTETWNIPNPNWVEAEGPNRYELEELGRKELYKE